MKEQDEEILDVLEEKPIEEDYEDYKKCLKKIARRIEKLPSFGQECRCEENTEIAHLIHELEMHDYQLIHFCLKCGGYVEW